MAEASQRTVGVGDGIVQYAVDGRLVEGLPQDAVGVAGVAVEHAAGVERELAHRVYLVVHVYEDIAAARRVEAGVVGLLVHGGVVGAAHRTVAAAPGLAVVGVLAAREAAAGEEVNAPLLLGPHIAHPWRGEGLVRAVDAKADELVALDVGRGDDVDHRLGVGGVLGRGVGDGLDACQGVGRQGLQVGLQVLLGELRRLVVNPYLDRAHAAQRHVALHVDLDAGGVLQGVLGGAGLYAGVFADVVYHLLAIHGVEGLLGRDLDGVEGGGASLDADGAEGGIVAYGERHKAALVADGRDAEQIAAGRHIADFKQAVEVGGGALHKAAVGTVEHGHVDERQELARGRVAQLAHHLEGVALLHFLLLLHLLGLLAALHLVPVALPHRRPAPRRPATAGETATGSATGTAGLRIGHRGRQQNHQRQGQRPGNVPFLHTFLLSFIDK